MPLPSGHVAQATAATLHEFRKLHNRKRSTAEILIESKDMLSLGLTTLGNGELIPDASSVTPEMAEAVIELRQAVCAWMAKPKDEALEKNLEEAMVRFRAQRLAPAAVVAPESAASSMDVDAGPTTAHSALNGEEADADANSASASGHGEDPCAPPTLVQINRIQSITDYCNAGQLGSTAIEECNKRIKQFELYAPTGRNHPANWLTARLRADGEIHTIVISAVKETMAYKPKFLLFVPRACSMTNKLQDIKSAVEMALESMTLLAAPKRTAEEAQLPPSGRRSVPRHV